MNKSKNPLAEILHPIVAIKVLIEKVKAVHYSSYEAENDTKIL